MDLKTQRNYITGAQIVNDFSIDEPNFEMNPFSYQVCFLDCFSCAFQNCFSQLANSIIALIKL